jgi:ribonuclease HII
MPDLALETEFYSHGYGLIAGVDEAGRGAWAGPVVAAAVILPLDRPETLAQLIALGVNDSKRLTARQRQRLAPLIESAAVAIGVGGASPLQIDGEGILPATRAAMERAIAMLHPQPQALLIDAVSLQSLISLPQRSLNYGDSLSLSIAAASIVAKVSRDRLMTGLDERYPGYGFARHKGYGTRAHQRALKALGVSEAHRKSYAPVARVIRRAAVVAY